MNQQKSNQEWQKFQSHLENFLARLSQNDVQKIEYKPKFIAQLLEMTSESHQNELQENGL
jgi:hypothetical protein